MTNRDHIHTVNTVALTIVGAALFLPVVVRWLLGLL